jgi:hypothetical protein
VDSKTSGPSRRQLLAQWAPGVLLAGTIGAAAGVAKPPRSLAADGWYDARRDFYAVGDGAADDTAALQAAINSGASAVRPIHLPPGSYKITSPLVIPPNTMLVGSAPGLGFGCRIEPNGCPALIVGGKSPSFQCSIENLLIWPNGRAPEFIVSVDNSYSVVFRNIRIHEVQAHVARAALLLLGDPATGGHGGSSNIVWDNLVIRNDVDQPPVAILASKGCGSHRFIAPDLENYQVLLEWQGGQIDLVCPYTERAGKFAVNCNPDAGDERAYLNTFGGSIDAARSGIACAIRSTTRRLNSFGTQWGSHTALSAYVYSLPTAPVNFHGVATTPGASGSGQFAGVDGWQRFVNASPQMLSASREIRLDVAAHGRATAEITVPGVTVGKCWARVMVNSDPGKLQFQAYVSAPDTATIVAVNATEERARISCVFTVECGLA